MEADESKSQSQGHDSQITSENVEGFQLRVNEILNLMEQDENFSEMTPEIYASKKSNLTKLVKELWRMHGEFADQHLHLIKEVNKNTHKFTRPIKTEHVGSSSSTSHQVNQTSKTAEFMTPVGFDVSFTDGGGFNLNPPVNNDASKVNKTTVHDHGPDMLLEKISTLKKENVQGFQQRVEAIINLVMEVSSMYEALADQHEQSIKEAIKTDHVGSSKSESLMSTSKHENPPINKDELKVKGKKVNDPDVLLKKISTLEKEALSWKKKIKDLTDENAILGAEKANVPELKETISKANRRIETMGNVLEGYRNDLKAADEVNSKLQQELSDKIYNLTAKMSSVRKQFQEEQAQKQELYEKVSLELAESAKRDEQITELNAQINLLKYSHAAEEGRLNAEIERLKIELMEKCELVDELNLKHDTLMSFTMDKKIGR